ncbi:hypothetical protein GCM10023198_47760 [Promicromonospora umidemergens]|uniref:Lipoprotein signal peptidase n=1 Tax=Promicromonospora umidemergens TaxID=629679 RepID=A0ABP8Y2C3_9MICO
MARARVGLAATAAVLAALDLGLKAWARRALADGTSVDLQVIQLRLTFNPGVAFSLGDTLPSGVVLGVTGLIVAGLAVFAWRTARTATWPARLGLAAMLAGAVANLADRAADGVVTDYLHSGWFPTFNLADVFLTLGAATLVLASLRTTDATTDATTDGTTDGTSVRDAAP